MFPSLSSDETSPTNPPPDIEKDPHYPPHGPRRVSYWRFLFDRALVTPEVLESKFDGSGTHDGPYVVTWIKDDPRNPMLFRPWRKWILTVLLAVITLAAAFISSSYSGCIPQIDAQFGVGDEVAMLGLSLYVLGFMVGPLMWAPLGEVYGRQPILVLTYTALTAFNAGAAASQNIESLLILRFFAGAFGASALTNTGAVIADMFSASERGLAMSLFATAPFLGPVLGPIVGGFVGQSIGWRWVEGLMAIFTGVLLILAIALIPETYAPVLLQKRAEKLSHMTGKVYASKHDIYHGRHSLAAELKVAISRPMVFLFCEPIVLSLSLWMAVIYGILYLFFGAMPIVYQEKRGWNQGEGGLAFLGIALGMMMSIVYSIYSNHRYLAKSKKGKGRPEERLPSAILGGIAIPISLFWFSWTNAPTINWAASVAAGIPFGFGMTLVFISIKSYLVDAYTIYAASALAATVVLRSAFGVIFPLFTTYMYHGLGIHWASMIPAFLALACAPIPFFLYAYGEQIRKRCKYSAEAEAYLRNMASVQSGDNIDEESQSVTEGESQDITEDAVGEQQEVK